MKTKSLIFLILILVIASCTKKQDPRPNIIFIMADDHARQAISAYGESNIQTPNIDRIAEEGLIFNNCFCTNAICAPSRATILTGKFNHVNGQIDNRQTFNGEQQTFPKLLQAAGYNTAIIGKWHLKSEPQGFDYWNILPGQGHYYNPDLIEMGKKKRVPGYVTDIITDISLSWINTLDKSKPFCLMLHHKAPHRSWMPRLDHINMFDTVDFRIPDNLHDDYTGRSNAAREQEMTVANHLWPVYDLKKSKFGNKEESPEAFKWENFRRMDSLQYAEWAKAYSKRKSPYDTNTTEWNYRRYQEDYLGTIAAVDENVGRILDYLDQSGLAGNTIIIYTSDQGFFLGEHGWYDKRFMYEEALGMPFLVRYPGKLMSGQTKNQLIQNVDFAPTFLEYAGLIPPEDMQGKSFKKVLEGDEKIKDEIYYHYYEYPAVHQVKRHYGIRTDRYKLIHFYYDIDEWEFYDLEEDPHEMNNLYNNPEHHNQITLMKAKLDSLRKHYQVPGIQEEIGSSVKTVDNKIKGIPLVLKYKPSEKYPGGESALNDGIINSVNVFSAGDYSSWMGFHGEDLDVSIQPPGPLFAKQMSIRFLDQTSNWIFPPKDVVLTYYTDKSNSTILENPEINVLSDTFGQKILEYIFEINNEIEILKLKAVNIGVCPDDHPGAGDKAWLFIDEIIVK